MEAILFLCGGAFIGLLIGGLLSTAKHFDNEMLDAQVQLLIVKLKEEERDNELLKAANESLMDDYLRLKQKYDENYIQLDAMKAKMSEIFYQKH